MRSLIYRLTLLNKFLLLGISITLVVAVTMATVVAGRLTAAQEAETARQAGFQVAGIINPLLESDDLDGPMKGTRYDVFREELSRQLPPEIVRVKIWDTQGSIVFSDEPRAIGQNFQVAEVIRALAGETVSHLEKMGAESENVTEIGLDELLEVYTPIRPPWAASVVGVYEIYWDAESLGAEIASMRRWVWSGSLLGFGALFGSLFVLVRGASRTLVTQNRQIVAARDQLQLAYDTSIEGLGLVLEKRDAETEGHSQRVTELMTRVLTHLGMPEEQILSGRRGALLHDIGKLGIPDAILLKPGPLNEEEWSVMRTHPVLAYEMLSPLQHLEKALDVPHYHHEKWDGSGYPLGLAGEAIPLAARAFALVDVWDALSSKRPYRDAWPQDKVMRHIAEQAGSHFDPSLVEPFQEVVAAYMEEEGRPAELPLGSRATPGLLTAPALSLHSEKSAMALAKGSNGERVSPPGTRAE